MKIEKKTVEFEQMRLEIRLKAKKGIDFILAASFIWLGAFAVWKYTLYNSYEKSVLTFILSAVLFPLALLFSKVLKTNWKIKENPLQSLGLWLNISQLIYFPFLLFLLARYPDYFIMGYAIITGAHLFPYAWLYKETGYVLTSIIISAGSLVIALIVHPDKIYYIPLFTALSLLILCVWIFISNKK